MCIGTRSILGLRNDQSSRFDLDLSLNTCVPKGLLSKEPLTCTAVLRSWGPCGSPASVQGKARHMKLQYSDVRASWKKGCGIVTSPLREHSQPGQMQQKGPDSPGWVKEGSSGADVSGLDEELLLLDVILE